MLYITFSEALEKAKLRIIREYEGKESTHRAWLEVHVDSYESESNRLQMIVLEGSPPKGWIIVNYGHRTLTAFDLQGNKLYRWTNLCPDSVRQEENSRIERLVKGAVSILNGDSRRR